MVMPRGQRHMLSGAQRRDPSELRCHLWYRHSFTDQCPGLVSVSRTYLAQWEPCSTKLKTQAMTQMPAQADGESTGFI